MKYTVKKIIILLIYSVPFLFLSMAADYYLSNLAMYMLSILAFFILYKISEKGKDIFIIIFGNFLSFFMSYIFTTKYLGVEMNYYFVPFTAKGLLIFESIVVLLIQLISMWRNWTGKSNI